MTRPITPDREDITRAWIERYLDDVHTAFPGKVQSYDAEKQTADIVPLIRHAVPQADGSFLYEELPMLPSVPVIFPRVGEWFMAFRVAEGDTMLVMCCESAIGHWRVGDGAIQHPGDTRRHHLSHAVAIPGLFVRDRALSNAPTDGASDPALVIGRDTDDGMRVVFTADDKFKITKGSTAHVEISSNGITIKSDNEVIVQGSAIKLKSA